MNDEYPHITERIERAVQPLRDRILELENVIAKAKGVSALSWHGPLTENEQRILRLEAGRQITELQRELAARTQNRYDKAV